VSEGNGGKPGRAPGAAGVGTEAAGIAPRPPNPAVPRGFWPKALPKVEGWDCATPPKVEGKAPGVANPLGGWAAPPKADGKENDGVDRLVELAAPNAGVAAGVEAAAPKVLKENWCQAKTRKGERGGASVRDWGQPRAPGSQIGLR